MSLDSGIVIIKLHLKYDVSLRRRHHTMHALCKSHRLVACINLQIAKALLSKGPTSRAPCSVFSICTNSKNLYLN